MKEFINEFISNLLGTLSLASYLSGMVMALIGAAVGLTFAVKKRDKLSRNTPVNFDWIFFIKDNFVRLFNGFLLTYVLFRFAPQILEQDFSMFYAFLVGLTFDQISAKVSKLQFNARK